MMLHSNLAYEFKYLSRYCRDGGGDYSNSKYFTLIMDYITYDKSKFDNIELSLSDVHKTQKYLIQLKNSLGYLINIRDIIDDVSFMKGYQDLNTNPNLRNFVNDLSNKINKFNKLYIINLIKDTREVIASLDKNNDKSIIYKNYLKHGLNKIVDNFSNINYDDKLLFINLLLSNKTDFDYNNLDKLFNELKSGVKNASDILMLIIDCNDPEVLIEKINNKIIYKSLHEVSYSNKSELIIEFLDKFIDILPRNIMPVGIVKMFCRSSDERQAIIYLDKLFSNFDIKIHSENLIYGHCLNNDSSFILKYLYNRNINMKKLGGLVFHEALYDKREKCLKEILNIYEKSTLSELVNSEETHRIFVKHNKANDLRMYIEDFDKKLKASI